MMRRFNTIIESVLKLVLIKYKILPFAALVGLVYR